MTSVPPSWLRHAPFSSADDLSGLRRHATARRSPPPTGPDRIGLVVSGLGLRRHRRDVRQPLDDAQGLGHSSTLAYLRTAMATTVLCFGLDDLDASTIRRHAPRGFTQEIASHLYDLADDDCERRLQGIEYASRLGDDIDNWAIWEPAQALDQEDGQPITADDPDLHVALSRFGLIMDGS